jgi:hypothetical protein
MENFINWAANREAVNERVWDGTDKEESGLFSL